MGWSFSYDGIDGCEYVREVYSEKGRMTIRAVDYATAIRKCAVELVL